MENNQYIPTLTKPKHQKIVIILIILLVAATGAATYIFLQNNSAQALASEKNSENASLKKQLAAANQKIAKDTPIKSDNTAPTQPTDEEAITTAAKNYDEARANITADEIKATTIKIIKNNGTFAEAGIEAGAVGGYGVTLKKVNGSWVVIASGQGGTDQDTIQRFGIPAGF